MPREETIKVKVDKVEALQSLKELKATADSIKKELGSIKVGDAAKAITEQAKAAKENAKAIAEQAKATKESANADKALAQAEKELANAVNARLKAQASAQSVQTAKLRTQKEAVNLIKAQSSAEKEAYNAEAAKSRAQKAALQTQNAINKSISGGSQYISNYTNALKSFATQLVGFYGITTTLRKAFSEMKAMNDELVTYRKVTGASAADMQKMQSAAYAAAKNYGQSPSDFLASAATMARAGYKENSAAMAELATKTQLVGDMTADQASKFLIAVDAAYKYQGNIKQLSSVLDSANEIDNKYATTIEKISEGMTLVASVASTAEVPIEQLMAALGTMTAVTQREGSEAARGLRYILLHAMGDTTTEIEDGVTATEEGIQTLNEAVMQYGDEAAKAALKAGKMINPMEKIVALQKAWKEGTISKESLYDIGLKVAGQRQYNMFMALIQNPDMYNSMMKDIANSAGSADKEWQAMMDSWSKKLEKLKATFTELVNDTISTDFIKSLIDAGTGALEFAGNLENLATMATGAYAAIKALSTGLGNLSKNQKFGGFNKAGIGIGIGIAAISALKTYGEYQFKASTEAAKTSAKESEEIVNNAKNLTSLIERYKEITADGIIDTDELSEAKTIQEQIKNLIGEQADAYDLLNGNVKDNIALLKEANIEYLKNALTAAKSKTSSAGVALYNANANILDKITGAGLRLDQTRINKGDVAPEVWEALLASPAFTTVLGFERTSTGRGHEGTMDRVPLAVQYSNTGFKGIINQVINGTYSGDMSADRVLEVYDSFVKIQQAYESAYSQAQLETNNIYRDIVQGVEHIKDAAEGYRAAINSEYSANAMLLLAEDDFIGKKLKSKDAVKAYTDELAKSKGLNENQAKALYDLAISMTDLEKAASSGAKSMTTAADGAITLASAIDTATNAKKKFDDAMKTSKADAFNDYVKAYETFKKEMDAGRVNSTAFYAAAQMILGEEKYNATGGTSRGVMNAINMRTAGDSGSAYDAWKILTDTYTNNKTGEAIEGFGFAELLRRTKGWGEAKITDANGNIVIPNLTSDQIAEIANAWHIDSAFLMAAWNAFDQYDVQGTRAEDDLMVQQQEENADAAEDAGGAEEALAESATAASSSLDAAKTSADGLASAMNNAADAANNYAGDQVHGGGGIGDDSNQSYFMDGADDLIEKQGAIIDTTKTLTKEYDDVIDGYNETNGEYDKLIQQAQEMSKKAAESLEETNVFLQESKTEETKKKADETQKVIDGMLSDPAFAAQVQDALDAKSRSEEPEEDIIGKPEDYVPKYAQAGEEAGKAFAEAESEAAENEADISFADYYPELASGYAQAGEEAGKQFGAEYWSAMLQTADRYGQGMDIPDTLRKQLEEDLAENGGDLWAVIEKYKKALADAKGEAEDLNEELGGTEEKEVDVDVKDDEAKEKVSDITKDVHKKVFIDIINRSTPNGGGGGGGNMMATYASGTRSHGGGPALVNDGSGPELIVQGGQAFIAGGGKPTVVGLQKGAKVFTAGETRSILGGSGIPAYADGTTTVINVGDVSSSSKKNISASLKKKKDKSKNKSSKSAKKVDDKAFTNLASVVDYIIGRIGTALDEQLDVIDSQIDALKAARDAAEEQNKLEELQKNVTDALNERTVRYLGEDGKWHWMADQKNVQQAQKALKEYEDDLAFNAQVKALEDQKKALQKEYDQITKMWGEIKDGVNTPTTSLSKAISAVLEGGTAQQKTGAKAVQSSLIGEMTGSVYKKNYKEALSSISKAASGKPIMPNSGNPSLASLIAMSGLGSAGSSVTQALKTATSASKSMTGSGNTLVGGNQTNINYFIDGIKLGQDMQNQPLSTIMRNLGVYTNTGVS